MAGMSCNVANERQTSKKKTQKTPGADLFEGKKEKKCIKLLSLAR